jgi:gluconolactonase
MRSEIVGRGWSGSCLSAAIGLALAVLTSASGCSSGGSGMAPADGGGNGSGGKAGTGGASGSGGTGPGSGGNSGTGGGAGGQIAPPPDGGSGDGTSDAGPRDGATDETGVPPQSALGPAGGACPGGAYPASPLPASLSATLVRGGLGGELEGPVWVAAQKALYFTQAGGGNANGRINKYTPADGMLTTFVSNVGVGGLAVDTQGMLLAASYDKRSITRFDPISAQRTDVAGGAAYNGQPFNEVNDIVMRSDGNIYFSDPQYDSVPRGTRPMAFYRLSPPPESKVTLVLSAAGANGVALSPDGAWLYLGTTEAAGPPVRRMALNADGSINGAGTAWKEASSDGMAMDCAGNLYLATDTGIRVVSPTDQALGTIGGLGNGYVTNSAFGDDDRQTLYITTSEGLYKIHLNIPGFPN